LPGANNIDIDGVRFFAPESLQKLAKHKQMDTFWSPARVTTIINNSNKSKRLRLEFVVSL
jgi:hypothetical protein